MIPRTDTEILDRYDVYVVVVRIEGESFVVHEYASVTAAIPEKAKIGIVEQLVGACVDRLSLFGIPMRKVHWTCIHTTFEIPDDDPSYDGDPEAGW